MKHNNKADEIVRSVIKKWEAVGFKFQTDAEKTLTIFADGLFEGGRSSEIVTRIIYQAAYIFFEEVA